MKDMRWYMVTVISGKEALVISALKNRAESENMQEYFEGFLVMEIPYLSPRELQKKNAGKTYKVRVRNQFPGYIFVKMVMTNEAWFMVRNTQYVTGLVGSSGQRMKPTPVSDAKVEELIKTIAKIKDDFNKGKIASPFKPGILVEITDGPAKGQVGTVLETNDDRAVATVEVILFERKTPVEVAHKHLQIRN